MARRYLRDKFSDPDKSDIMGRTKLQRAVEENDIGRIRSLLLSGADPNLSDTVMRYPPLMLALSLGNKEVVDTLLDHAHKLDINENVVRGKRQKYNPLALLCSDDLPEALKKHQLEIIDKVLDRGADPLFNLREWPTFDSPLHMAVEKNDVDAVKLMISRKPWSVYINGETLAHYAVLKNATDCLKVILETDPFIGGYKSLGKMSTPLHLATALGKKDLIDVLLATPRNFIDAQNRDGDTALHLAVKSERLTLGQKKEIVEKLLDCGANPLAQNNLGDSVFHLIARRPFAGDAGLFELIAGRLDDPKKLEIKDKSGLTPLFVVAVFGSQLQSAHGSPSQDAIEIADFLLDLGADPNITDAMGMTALDRLADKKDFGHSSMAQRLMTGGAELTKRHPLRDVRRSQDHAPAKKKDKDFFFDL